MQPPNDMEAVLCRAYDQQRAHYARALEVVKEVNAAFAQQQDTTELLRQLAELMDQAWQIDQRTQEARNTWQATQRRPGAALSAALDRTRAVIEEFLGHVHEAEKVAAHAKARLTPKLDAESRGQRMRFAYGAAVRHA